MNILPYHPNFHERVLREWLVGWGKNPDLMLSAPEIGRMAYRDAHFYASGFLRRVEGDSIAILDGLMANPKTFGKARYVAIDEVVFSLIKKAEELKVKSILAWSKDTGTLKRSKKFGFQDMGESLIILKL